MCASVLPDCLHVCNCGLSSLLTQAGLGAGAREKECVFCQVDYVNTVIAKVSREEELAAFSRSLVHCPAVSGCKAKDYLWPSGKVLSRIVIALGLNVLNSSAVD